MARILLATDGGHGADGAARLATLLARRLGAELAAVVVCEPMLPLDFGYGMTAPSAEMTDALGQELADAAAAQLQRCGASDCEARLQVGPPAMEIAARGRADQAIVVVLGLGAHDAMARALGRETALQVVQVAGTPVLAVPSDVVQVPRCGVCAIDFTPTSMRAARLAAGWLAGGDALHLVHVATPGEPASAHRAEADRQLRALADELASGSGIQVKHAVLEGSPAAAVLDYVARSGADLIALGSHGYGLWKRLTIGSVASKILRLGKTSVLVVPIGAVATS